MQFGDESELRHLSDDEADPEAESMGG